MELQNPPRVPLDLVEWLESFALRRLPDPADQTAQEAWAYIGQLALIRRLRATAQEQINPSQD